jgi:hypothetical protein
MPYNRFYSQFTDEQGWQYTLYLLPSDANIGLNQDNLSTTSSFTLVELPDDFIMRNMKIDTELGDIPTGLVSQTMEITVNLGACQGTPALDALRESLLRGTVQNAYPYNSSGAKVASKNSVGASFGRFNTFILLVDDGSGQRPVFIGAQKFASENELNITRNSDVIEYKIECFDIFRAISESISANLFVEYMTSYSDTTSVNYGNSFSEPLNSGKTEINLGKYYARPESFEQTGNVRRAVDYCLDEYSFFVAPFTHWKTLADTMLSDFMRSFVWNTASSLSLPIPFNKAWTFYEIRDEITNPVGNFIERPCYIAEIYKYQKNGDTNNVVAKRMGGVLSDPNAFSKFSNTYEMFVALVENSLEIYRLQYSMSLVNGSFSASYTSDFIRPLTGSGITFNNANVYNKASFKLFQETVKSASASCSMLQGDKDTKEMGYSEQGTSADNGKDVELIFHNLGSATNRQYRLVSGELVNEKFGINAGTIVWNNQGKIEKPDTQCQFKYSNTDAVSLNLPYVLGEWGSVNGQLIREQQTTGLPYTLAYSMVKAMGTPKQVVMEFGTRHSSVAYYHVGTQCTVDINSLNPFLTKIYNSNTGTGVITSHKLDVYSGKVNLTVRMYA